MPYLDHAATSYPKPDVVLDSMSAFARASGANPGRSGHRRAVQAEAMIQETRRLLASLFGLPRPERLVFTTNATDALNMAIKGLVRKGDHVVTSELEHNSVIRPLNRLEKDGVIQVTRVRASGEHLISPEDVARAFTPATRLVVLTHASNVTGTIQPIAEIGKLARERGARLLVDASQTAGAVPIDMVRDGIDLLAFTGHKGLLGPTGTGGLAVGEGVELRAWREGGTGGDSTSPLQPAELPHALEGGTPNVFGIAGLRAAVRFLQTTGVEKVLAHERALICEFYRSLRDPGKFQWYGADRAIAERGAEGRVGLVCLNVPGFVASEVAAILDQQFDIAVRAGLHCAPHAHRHLGTSPDGALRISVGLLTTEADVREAARALDEIAAG
ncbi:MAG TPA: aminotransferase class V-fold PLP-dependent enzyme [Bdellovibrionota bacterium]|nr:aminotransferase class V-fold PLP-dependent enzyme [Bdellovibrionota bacterium]